MQVYSLSKLHTNPVTGGVKIEVKQLGFKKRVIVRTKGNGGIRVKKITVN